MKPLTCLALAGALAITAFSASARADAITLNFEGIAPYPNSSDVLIGQYYDGGTSSIGTSGQNYGVAFSSGATELCLNTAGTFCSNTSKGGLGVPGSEFGAMYFPDAQPLMDVAAGFSKGFSFAYSSPYVDTTVSLYSGLDGTGDLLASTTLPLTAASGCDASISSGAQYCPFSDLSIAFNGTAKSVLFGGQVNRQVFDDFTFGSTTVGAVSAAPEPESWSLMMLGIALVGACLKYVRRSAAFGHSTAAVG